MILWIFVILAITLNGLAILNPNNQLFDFLFQLFNHIPYGHYLARKWFLVIIALVTLFYWLIKNKISFEKIKPNLLPLLIIALSLLVARFYSFQGWFWHDDYREIGYFYNNTGYVDAHYPFALFFLVIRWFHLNYTLYNALTLMFYFLSGFLVYLISNQLQNKKYVSLLAAIFFVTTPSYFQEWFLMINFAGNAFVLLLFLTSFYLVLKQFLPGALIFAAAALEFGLVRTNLIPFYIILAGLLFTPKKLLLQKYSLLALSSFLIILLPYIPFSLASLGFSPGVAVPTNLNRFFTIGNMLGEIAIPFFFFPPLMRQLGSIFNNWPYIPVVFGYFILLVPISLIFFFRKRVAVSKIIFLALFIFVSGVIVPSLIGRRVDHNVEKFLERHQTAPYPTVTTAYSIFSVFGLTLFLVGLGIVTKPKVYKMGMLVLITLNAITYIKSDQAWVEKYAYPQRKEDSQLKTLLPETKPLYIHVLLSSDPALKHYQRHLWQGIRNFQMAYRPNQMINIYMNQKDFEDIIEKDKPEPAQIYYLAEDSSYNIQDLSEGYGKEY